MKTANRVALNSVALYANMVTTMGVTLLATRFLLQALGSTQYGIYALIVNIVAMFSFINVAMSVATQRFISFAIGNGVFERVKEVFYNNIVIHIWIAVILSALLFALGIPAIEYWLDIPADMRSDTLVVLFFMVVNVVFLVMSVPYDGLMNAKEDIVVIAGINIADAVFKFLASVAVLLIDSNELVIYAGLVMCSGIMVFMLKRGYSRSHYQEALFEWHKVENRSLVKSIMGFAAWNLIGAGCSLARYQGAAVLLNKFFGLAVNAAYGIAQQLNSFLLFFANSLVRPMRPQIVKSEAAGLHKQMTRLSSTLSKISFIALLPVVVSLYINMPYVLHKWLVAIPEGVLELCRGFLVIALVGQLSIGLQVALESVGRIKLQQIIVGLMHLLPLPAAYILFTLGYSAYTIMYCIIAEEFICLILRILIARIDANMPIPSYAREVVFPCILLAVFSFLTIQYFDFLISAWHPFTRLAVTTIASLFIVSSVGYFLCLSQWEKKSVKNLLCAVKRRLFRS